MSLAISRRDRRTLLAGTGTLVALVALAKGLPAWRAWDADVRAAAAETVAEAARAERRVLALPALRDTLAARNARYLDLAELIVPGEGPAAAAGELGAFVSGSATAADLAVGAMQVRVDTADAAPASPPPVAIARPADRPRSASPFARVSVQGDLTGDVFGLTSFLADIERGPMLLAVRELAITQPEPGAPADRPEMLRVLFVVEGIALWREPRGAARHAARRSADSAVTEARKRETPDR